LLVVIVLGAGTDYGLFLIFRMREELRAGRDPKDAVVVSVTRVGESITFSAVTVMAALVSLLLASFGLYKGLGPGLAIGIGVVLIANLTLLPALLALMGRAVFWPLIPKPGQTRRSVWGAVASRVVGRPVLTLVIGVTAFGGLALVVLDYSPAGFGAPSVSSTSDSAQGQAALTAHFATAESNPTNVVFTMPSSVWQHPAVLSRAQSDLQASGLFSALAGALDPNGRGTAFTPGQLTRLYEALGPPQSLPVVAPATSTVPTPAYEAYRATAQFVSADGRTVLYDTSLSAGGPETAAALNAIPRVRTEVASVAARIGAVDNGVAGEAPSLNDVASVSAHDLAKILPIVMIVLALLLALMVRSLVAPIYLVLSVALSYLAALGLAVLVFVVIGGQVGINFVLPFFMFIFIMALGEDYNILVMSRIREEAHTLSLPDAVRRAVQATGTTVTSAGLILAGTFAVLTAAGGTQVQEIGIGLAVGVLLDTFLVRTLLVPSTVVLMGRWNWWPSKLWREETIESRLWPREGVPGDGDEMQRGAHHRQRMEDLVVPEHPGNGVRFLHRVADRPDRVTRATGEDQREPDTSETVQKLRDDGERGPAGHDVGHGDGPLGSVQPYLAHRDADGTPEPHQTQHEDLGPPVHGEPGHGGVGPGDGQEDRRVIGAPHAPAAHRGPADAVEGGTHAEERGERHDVDGQRGARPVGVGMGHEQRARHQHADEGDEMQPPAQHRPRGLGLRCRQCFGGIEVWRCDARERSHHLDARSTGDGSTGGPVD
jgi:hypothetical protein